MVTVFINNYKNKRWSRKPRKHGLRHQDHVAMASRTGDIDESEIVDDYHYH